MKRLLGILALTVWTPILWGQAAPRASKVKTLRFLTAAEIDPARLLPPPPSDGSDVQKLELADLKRLLNARTPERFAQAKWDEDHEDSTVFAAVIGSGFEL